MYEYEYSEYSLEIGISIENCVQSKNYLLIRWKVRPVWRFIKKKFKCFTFEIHKSRKLLYRQNPTENFDVLHQAFYRAHLKV